MFDVLRQRLSEEEQEQYDRYDGRAALACHFLMWPLILAFAFYYSGLTRTALLFFAISAVALPIMLIMAKRARAIRELAEERYAAIMNVDYDAGKNDSGQSS